MISAAITREHPAPAGSRTTPATASSPEPPACTSAPQSGAPLRPALPRPAAPVMHHVHPVPHDDEPRPTARDTQRAQHLEGDHRVRRPAQHEQHGLQHRLVRQVRRPADLMPRSTSISAYSGTQLPPPRNCAPPRSGPAGNSSSPSARPRASRSAGQAGPADRRRHGKAELMRPVESLRRNHQHDRAGIHQRHQDRRRRPAIANPCRAMNQCSHSRYPANSPSTDNQSASSPAAIVSGG